MYFIGVGGVFIQPTAHSVLFEDKFHLHMLLLTHTVQIEFLSIIYFNFKSCWLVLFSF